MFMRNDLVVLSIDLASTFSFDDIELVACFKGLKLRTVDKILFEMDCRVRTRIERQFKVASIKTASLVELR